MKLRYFWIGLAAIGLASCSTPETVSLEVTSFLEESLVPSDTPRAAEETPIEEPPDLIAEPIDVTFFTPSQGEGPYYTVNKPEDRDNDLTVVAGVSAQPGGEILRFSGKVYAASGFPVEGAVIEIWQTDSNGIYMHPGDPSTDERDPNFQFYGEATTAADGSYWFRTILPGKYEPRPMHIHFKVRVGGQVILTSQFYFQGDSSLSSDSLFTGTGRESEYLIITLYEGEDENGDIILMSERDIILNIN